MPQPTKLLFGVHAHQPVGNFPEVLDDAHQRCYGPFLRCMARFPDFPFAIHCSGWLLEYLIQHFPDDLRLLRDMVHRGQAELFGAGDTEPVLAVIPSQDRLGQIRALSDRLERHFGVRPTGAWLTERVWEATVVPSLADAGIQYVTVDDYHFFCTGKSSADLDGFYSTDEDGRRLDLFPISEDLRYRFPFSPADDTIRYLEGLANERDDRAAVYFDDIEKFGIWPETYHWVYEQGWLEQFVQGVLNSPLVTPMRYRDYHDRYRTRGVVYIPTTSYIEMNEWTLPASAAHRYADLVQAEKNAGRYDDHKPFIRGGIWKNFLSRYPESNWMHKRMLGLSRRVQSLPAGKATPDIITALYEAQANDAYWHGLFGGLYLPHLRRAIYQAIVRLEGLLDAQQPREAMYREDLNFDGVDEVVLRNKSLQLIVRPQFGASLGELDVYPLSYNLADTLARQEEHYYRRISADNKNRTGNQAASHGGILSPHERMTFKHDVNFADLQPDPFPRGLFLDFWNHDGHLVSYRFEDGDSSREGLIFKAHNLGFGLIKNYRLDHETLIVEYLFQSPDGNHHQGEFSTQINVSMPSANGPAGRVVIDGEIGGGFGSTYERDDLSGLVLSDDILGGALHWTLSPPAHLHAEPHHTVSQSEDGFEKIMQAFTLRLRWPVSIHADQREFGIQIKLRAIPQ